MGSGYTHCKCRDCFDIVVSGDTDDPALCGECDAAGCTSFREGGGECCRPDAYGVDTEER